MSQMKSMTPRTSHRLAIKRVKRTHQSEDEKKSQKKSASAKKTPRNCLSHGFSASPNPPLAVTPRGRGRPKKLQHSALDSQPTHSKAADCPPRQGRSILSETNRPRPGKDQLSTTALEDKHTSPLRKSLVQHVKDGKVDTESNEVFSQVAAVVCPRLLPHILDGAGATLTSIARQSDLTLDKEQEYAILTGTYTQISLARQLLKQGLVEASKSIVKAPDPISAVRGSTGEATAETTTAPTQTHGANQHGWDTRTVPVQVGVNPISGERVETADHELEIGEDATGGIAEDAKEYIGADATEGIAKAEQEPPKLDEDSLNNHEESDTAESEAVEDIFPVINLKHECLAEEDSTRQPSPRRSGRGRKLEMCMHQQLSCKQCVCNCDLCGYRSTTEVNIKKHKIRVHPECTYDCEICACKFGIRYDMRRHRVRHFDLQGNLTDKASKLYKQVQNVSTDQPVSVTLIDFEPTFVPSPQDGVDLNFKEEKSTEHIEGESAGNVLPDESPVSQHEQLETQVVHEDTKDTSRRTPLARGKKNKVLRVFKPPKEQDVLECKICQKRLRTRGSLQMHMKSHQRKETLRCKLCNFNTFKLGLYRQHMRRYHCKQEDRQCDECGVTFTLPESLTFHKISVHQKNMPEVCQDCGKGFNTRRFLQAHIKRMHRPLKMHLCRHCGRAFSERNRLRKHEITHLTQSEKDLHKKHICSFCGRAFSQLGGMRQHENIHRDIRPHVCSICHKAFRSSPQLAKHKAVHREVCPFVCTYCHKGFKFPYKLTEHMVIHTKKGGHHCPDCRKVYTSLSTLKKHNCKAQVHAMILAANTARNSTSGLGPETMRRLIIDSRKLSRLDPEVQTIVVEESAEACNNLENEKKFIVQLAGDSTVDNSGMVHLVEVNTEDMPEEKQLIINSAAFENAVSQAQAQMQQTTPPEMDFEAAQQMVEDEEEAIENSEGVMYMCGVCNEVFETQEIVNNHIAEEHEELTMVYKDEAELEQDILVSEAHELAEVPLQDRFDTEVVCGTRDEHAVVVGDNASVILVSSVSEVVADADVEMVAASALTDLTS